LKKERAWPAVENEPRPASLRSDGWLLCPFCGKRFSTVNGDSWRRDRHLTCGQKIEIIPPPVKPLQVLIVPNAFKGTLTALQAAKSMAAGVKRVLKDAEITIFPMSDGGGGFLDAMLAMNGGRARRISVPAPHGRPIWVKWGMVDDTRTAIVEMARSSGLNLVPENARQPLSLSSFGTGMVIRRALAAERLVIGLGDTATVDGGAGILQALGVRLRDADGRELPACAATLARLASVDLSKLDPRVLDFQKRGGKITLACDVDNPLLGPRGAATVFGPQKGAKRDEIPRLERNLTQLADLLEVAANRRCRDLPGAGAAGGAGWALACLFDAEFVSGAELVLQSSAFQAALARADLVITGEGALDRQSLAGKGPVAVAQAAHAARKRVIAFTGRLSLTADKIRDAGFSSAVELPPHPPEKARAALAAAVARSFRKGA
jgi:glycerate kinase